MKRDLKKIRNKIDQIDTKIVELLNQRAQCAIDVGHAKNKSGRSIYAPARESEIFQRLEHLGKKGVIPPASLKAIYREIMSASFALEKPLTIAYLGPQATFTHLASVSKFGSSVEYVACDQIRNVFKEVEQGRADYGVVPVENSTEGAVTHALDTFLDSDVKIYSEILFSVSHHLMSKGPKSKIKRIYSHRQVFGQCRQWLDENMAGVERIETASTTAAAEKARSLKSAAAIGSRLASSMYGLKIVSKEIQDLNQNMTRFLVLAREEAGRSGKDKTSIVVGIKNKKGALVDLLAPFKRGDINMTKIESRPSKQKAWNYFFFIDFMGHKNDAKVQRLLRTIERSTNFIKVLGSYPLSQSQEL